MLPMPSSRVVLPTLLALTGALLACSALTPDGSNAAATTIAFDFSDCNLSQGAKLSDGGSTKALTWTGCRIFIDETPGIKSAIVEFAPPGTSGSYALPGNGWMMLSIPLPGSTATFASRYVFPSGRSVLLRHNFTGANSIAYDKKSAEFLADLAAVSFLNADGTSSRFSGSVRASAASASTLVTATSSGTTSTNTTSSRCTSYVNQCNQPGAQAACYCAAACAFATAGGHPTEEQQMRANAQQLGTTCSY